MSTYSRVLVVFSFMITHMFGNSLLMLVMPLDISHAVSGLHNAAFEVLMYVLQAYVVCCFRNLRRNPGNVAVQ